MILRRTLFALLLVAIPAGVAFADERPLRGADESALVRQVIEGSAVARKRAETELRRRGVRMVHPVRRAMGQARAHARAALKRLAEQLLQDYHRRHQPPGMVYVPAGSLVEPRAVHPWGPGATRTHVAAFYLDRTEVTVGAWRAWREHVAKRNATGLGRLPMKPPEELPASFPVTRVTWEEAARFAAEYRGGRLPTVEEFERATRGAGLATWPWGARYIDGRARLGLSSEDGPVPVGSFPSIGGRFGALDLVGNVAEWTATTKQAGKAARSRRAYLFGGSYRDRPEDSLTWRNPRKAAGTSRDRRPWIGFRVARDVPELPPAAQK